MPYDVRIGPDPDLPSLERVTLVSPDGVEASFVPAAGMVGVSLTLDGVELLARRHGLEGYVGKGSTFGIPLLAPWANRLGSPHQQVAGRSWEVVAGAPGVHLDEYDQPIHGLVPAAPGWSVTGSGSTDDAAHLSASWEFAEDGERFASFPFPFRLDVTATLTGTTLRVATTVTATSGTAVPVAFGWHPWFAFPDVARAEWELHGPFRRRVVLGPTKIPTGEVVDEPLPEGPLGTTVLDDVFVDVAEGAVVRVRAGSRGVSVRYVSGYPVGVVFAPDDLDVVCVEPMSAPTDPFSGRFPLRLAEPGAPSNAVFEVTAERWP
jgi:aldose 1-epimerase